jgi:nanoRNase/pAp phosphatase (c-di-AMP/oligoRNAs hydrolase)
VRSNAIAETFGGGGHKGAAGFTTQGELDKVIARTLAEVEKELLAHT